MKFLKVLINSLLSSFFFSCLLSLLISDLNINLSFNLTFFAQLSFFLFITYGVFISLFCIILFFIIQFFFGRKFKIAFISPSFLSISFSLILFLFLLIFKGNIRYFLTFFDLEIQKIITAQATLFLVIAILGPFAFYCFYRFKKKVLFFWIHFFLLIATMIYAVNQRYLFPIPLKSIKVANIQARTIDHKITIIGLEGLSFDFLIPLIDDGKLPNFSWFMEKGSWGKLETFSPSEPIILNNSFNTGKLPSKHRQISLYKYHLLNVSKPIEVTPRFIFFRQWSRIGLIRIVPNESSLMIKDIWKILKDNKTPFLKMDWPYEFQIANPTQKSEKLFNLYFKELKYEPSDIFNIMKQAFFRDTEYEEKISQEKNGSQPQVIYFLLNGLNIVETYFYKYSFPDLFGNIDQEDINKYSSIIEKYYQFYDQIIGKYLASLKEDEVLVVYSPHGIEALPLWKRFVEWLLGNAEVSAYHENAPEGMIFFYGKEIVRGKNLEGMKLIDITPTLLHYLGLPVGKDMDGIVNSSIFVEEFKVENPILYISSYEEITIKSPL